MEYEKGQLLKNGSVRKTVWCNCCPEGTQTGSEAHAAGHRRAEELAWKRMEAVPTLVKMQKGEAIPASSTTTFSCGWGWESSPVAGYGASTVTLTSRLSFIATVNERT